MNDREVDLWTRIGNHLLWFGPPPPEVDDKAIAILIAKATGIRIKARAKRIVLPDIEDNRRTIQIAYPEDSI